MSNTIQIKRGSGAPDKALAPYELGFDTVGSKLYIGGPIQNGEYGQAIAIQVERADQATRAQYLVNTNNQPYSAGSETIPVFLKDGIIVPCASEDVSMGMTVEAAQRLTDKRTFSVDLDKENTTEFDGTANVQLGVGGVLPITKGGTGATNAADARANLGINLTNLGVVATADELNFCKGLTLPISDLLNQKSGLGTFSNIDGTTIIKIGNLVIEYGLIDLTTVWTFYQFKTTFELPPSVTFTMIGKGNLGIVKLQDNNSVTNTGFTASTYSGSYTYYYQAIGMVS